MREWLENNPWDYLQPRDIKVLGEVIKDPVEQARWARAMFLGGQLPYVWDHAREFKDLMYRSMDLRFGDKVLCVGEGIDTCGFEREISARIGESGELICYEIMDEARLRLDRGESGQWRYNYSEKYPDAYFDAVVFPQGIHHAVDWCDIASDFIRVLKPGRPVVLAEARFGPEYERAIESHVLIYALFRKLRTALGYFTEGFIDFGPQDLEKAFSQLLDGVNWFEWKGFLLYHGKRLK